MNDTLGKCSVPSCRYEAVGEIEETIGESPDGHDVTEMCAYCSHHLRMATFAQGS